MPETHKFKVIKKAFEKEYGKKKGDSFAYAYANKHNIVRH